jgi:PAS domain S-box-containing protein
MPSPSDRDSTIADVSSLIPNIGPGIYVRAWTATPDGKPLTGLEDALAYSGLTLEDFKAQGPYCLYHPDDRDRMRKRWEASLQTLSPYEHSHRVRRADGVYRWFFVRAKPITKDGVVSHWLGIAVDINAFVNAHLAAAEGTQRLFALGSMTASLVFTADADGAFSTPQPDWERYTGQTFEQYAGWGRTDAMHPDCRKDMRDAWRQAVASGSEVRFRGGVWHAPSQSYRSMIARAIPIKAPDGTVIEWVGAYTDLQSLYAQVSQWVVERNDGA